MVSQSAKPQPCGYPTLRSALLGDAPIPAPKGAAVPIEPRIPGSKKAVPRPPDQPSEAAASPEFGSLPTGIEPVVNVPICFQCPKCCVWLRIEDPAAYAGDPSDCPTCGTSIVGPRLA